MTDSSLQKSHGLEETAKTKTTTCSADEECTREKPEKERSSMDIGKEKRFKAMMSKLLGTLSQHAAEAHGSDSRSLKHPDKSDNFFDIDDAEMATYLLNDEEKFLKKIMWENMNEGYLKEQATKKAAAAASRKTRLAAGAASEKGPKRCRTEAETAEGARGTDQTNEKRRSSKINYDLLDKLLGESL